MTELGNRLKQAREDKGLSLEDLQNITKIQKRYLQGIEEGNYSLMPGKFYVRAFIKQYAEAVGIEPESLFDEYKSEIPLTHNDELPENLSRVQTRKEISPSNSKILEVLPKIIIGLFVIGAFVTIWYLLQLNSSNDPDTAVQDENETVNFEEQEPAEQPEENTADSDNDNSISDDESETDTVEEPVEETPKQELTVLNSSGRASTYELKNAESFNLKLTSSGGDTWVNVKNGKGYSFFQGMLSKSDQDAANDLFEMDLSKETEVVLVIGSAVNTEIYINGEKLEYAVSPTEIVRQDVTIQYVSENPEE